MSTLLLLLCFAHSLATAGKLAPLEFLACRDRNGPLRGDLLLPSPTQAIACKFAWRVTPSVVSFGLTGYAAANLSLLYDTTSIRRAPEARRHENVTDDNDESATRVCLIQEPGPGHTGTEFTWLEVQFNYTSCANRNSNTLELSAVSNGDEQWPPVVVTLRQSALRCPADFYSWLPWHREADTNQASDNDITLPFIALYFLIVLCIFCVGCIYIDPRTGE